MPLTGNVSADIHELTHHGSRERSHKQIVAIALHEHAKHMHGADYNADHHADDHGLGNAHPHQQHSEMHHRMEKLPVSPGAKSYDHDAHAVRDGVPHHMHRHHVHPDRDKDMEHLAPTHHGEMPGHTVNGGY